MPMASLRSHELNAYRCGGSAGYRYKPQAIKRLSIAPASRLTCGLIQTRRHQKRRQYKANAPIAINPHAAGGQLYLTPHP